MTGLAAAFAMGGAEGADRPGRAVDGMSAALRHRGPPGARFSDGVAVLAPLGGVVVRRGPFAAAGEVRLDRRDALASALGVDPREASDGDLLLAGWERWGDAVVDRAHGDFAFVVWDPRERVVTTLRDAFGVKPLYLAHAGDLLLLASEMPALVASRLLPPVKLDRVEAGKWLLHEYTEDGPTIFQGIFAAQAAGVSVFRGGEEQRRRAWWPDPFLPAVSRDLRQCAEALRDALDSAVRSRMPDARNAAVLVSGGLDSSSVACLAAAQARAAGAAPPPLLHVAFPGLACDEADYIAAVAATTGAPLFEVDARRGAPTASPARNRLGPGEIFDGSLAPFDDLFDVADLPPGTVLLNGMGGDDLVHDAGLDCIDALREGDVRRAVSAARAHRPLHRGLARHLLRQVGVAFVPRSVRRVVRRHRRAWPSWLEPAVADEIHAWHLERMAWREAVAAPTEVQRHYAQLLLGDADLFHFLSRLDRMFARRGLDARHPFYDRRVVDELLRTPNELRFGPHGEKQVLREALRGVLPEKVRTRTDAAVFVPFLTENLRGPHREAHIEAFSAPELERAGVVRPGTLRRLLEEGDLRAVLKAVGLEVAFRTIEAGRAT